MTICVTGGHGFIGGHLVQRLLAGGARIRMLSRIPRTESEQIQIFQADLTNSQTALGGLFEHVDVIYNCAGEVKNSSLMGPLHVDGTQRLLHEAQQHILQTGRSLHWVQLSSVGVYGPPSGPVDILRDVDETTPAHPYGEYEVTKFESDQLVLRLAAHEPRFTFTILRPSIVVAGDMPNQSVKSLVAAIRSRKFFYIGSAQTISTYVHIDDVIDALMLIGSDPRAKGQIFNLSNDCFLHEIVDAIHRHEGMNPYLVRFPVTPLRLLVDLLAPFRNLPLNQQRIDAMIKRTRYSNQKMKEILDYSPIRSIPETITSLFNE